MLTELAVQRFETSGGAAVFQIPLLVFPGLWGRAYLVLTDGYQVLIDSGSGYGVANEHLAAGFSAVSDATGSPIAFSDLTHILLTHGHIDHIGGLPFLRQQTEAVIGIHELDRRVVTNHGERLAVASRRLGEFLVEAGVREERAAHILDLYRFTKAMFRSVSVDFTYEAAGMRLGPFEFLHVPGHCAGHVVIRLHDVLFTGDHVLDKTSPHQSPEVLTHSTGLEHYLRSLDRLQPWAAGARLTFGGHESPIVNLPARITEIQNLHRERLQKTLDILRQPHTVAEVSQTLFGEVHGYDVLLAIEEAGAHVEFLYNRGQLEIENLADVERSDAPVPIRYRCVECCVG